MNSYEKLIYHMQQKQCIAMEIIYQSNHNTATGWGLDEIAKVIEISPRKDLECDAELRKRIQNKLSFDFYTV